MLNPTILIFALAVYFALTTYTWSYLGSITCTAQAMHAGCSLDGHETIYFVVFDPIGVRNSVL
jgi:hypothetical protein